MSGKVGDDKLLPCPFCGSSRIATDCYIRDGREVHCRECGAATHAFNPEANAKAIVRWNSRAALSASPQDGWVLVPRKHIKALAEGYFFETKDDRYIIIDNPDYAPDNGSDPKLVIDALPQPTGDGT